MSDLLRWAALTRTARGLLALAVAVAAGPALAGTVKGTVRDARTGAVLSGVTVKVTQQSTRKATTNWSGAFSISSVAAGSVTLTASKSGYLTTTTPSVQVPASGTVTAPDIQLSPRTGSIAGTVVDAATGRPLPGAVVRVEGLTPLASATSDSEGAFTLGVVPVGTWNLTTSKPGYREAAGPEVEVVEAETASAGEIALEPVRAVLAGQILDVSWSYGVSDVLVTAARSGASTTTDGDGRFRLDGLATGFEILVVSYPDTPPFAFGPFLLHPDETVEITESLPGEPWDWVEGLAHGTICDASGAPVAGATVSVVGVGEAISGPNGGWRLAVPQGRHVVTAHKEGFEPALSLPHGENSMYVDGPWQLQQDLTLYPADATGTIEVTTRDPVTRAPRPAERWLYTAAMAIPVRTADDGRAVLAGVPPGLVLGGVVPRTLEPDAMLALDLHADGTVPATGLQWAAGGILYRAATGLPVAAAVVTLRNEGAGFEATATTDVNGRWSFAGGPTGEYEVTAVGGGGLYTFDAWRFDAQDDGWTRVNDMPLVAPGDAGTLIVESPQPGAVLGSRTVSVRCAFELPRDGDYVVNARAEVVDWSARSVVNYEPDGRHVRIDLERFRPDRPFTVVISALARHASLTHGESLSAELPLAFGPLLLTLEPRVSLGSASIDAKVELASPAPPGGTVVALASSDPALVAVPADVVVAAGRTWVDVDLKAADPPAPAEVTISATAGGATGADTLTVTPVAHGPQVRVERLTLWPSSLESGQKAVASLKLAAVAPSPGAVVFLSAEPPGAIGLPAAVVVPADDVWGSFEITALAVASPTPVTLTATAAGASLTATLTVLPIVPPKLASVSIGGGAAGACGGTALTGSVGLDKPAPAGGLAVALASDSPAAAVPASVTVPAGAVYGAFTVVTSPVAATTEAHVTASLDGASVTATATVRAPQLSGLKLSRLSVADGWNVEFNRVFLDCPAGPGSFRVALASSNPAASVPAAVGVREGETEAEFVLTTSSAHCQPQPVTVTASAGAVTLAREMTVVPTEVLEVTLGDAVLVPGRSTRAVARLSGRPDRSSCPVLTASADLELVNVAPGLEACSTTSGLAGSYRCPFAVTVRDGAPPGATVEISATGWQQTRSATLTVGALDITGVAPGVALAGDEVTVYGPAFTAGAGVELAGPVYPLSGGETELCSLGQTLSLAPYCARRGVPAAVAAAGRSLAFAVPGGLAPGVYYLRTTGPDSNVGRWLMVEEPARTFAVVPPEEHQLATRIWPGQTVTGTLAGDTPAGGVADWNFHYFVAAAGARVDIAMERADASLPWEHPDSLDPQLEVIAPDGFVYQNLVKFDDRPGVDLDASLVDAVLPLTGLYVIAAETTRGRGDYRLAFRVRSPGSATLDERPVVVAGNDRTMPLGTPVETASVMLDPRGRPLSGAQAVFERAGGGGDVTFGNGRRQLTSVDGFALATVTPTVAGKTDFGPRFIAGFDGAPASGFVAHATGTTTVARYQAVARVAYSAGVPRADRRLPLAVGAVERLGVERRSPRTLTQAGDPASGSLAADSDGGAFSSLGPEPRAPAPGLLPADASTAVPLATLPRSARALGITDCTAAPISLAAYATQMHPPYTMTLTDLTPPPGAAQPNGEVGAEGIRGHRVGTTARLRLEVRDAEGNVPEHPVLVRLRLGGLRHGTIVLDPDGARVECAEASFLWHERDAQGNLVAPNDEFELRLGTLATLVGVLPDATAPHGLRPVWGETEQLEARLEVGGGPSLAWGVHPEAGQPDRMLCYQGDDARACPDVFSYWSGYFTVAGGWNGNGTRRLTAGPLELGNAYVLADRFGNTCFGYPAASATPPAPNVQLEFASQLGRSGDPAQYLLTTRWSNDPAMPQGRYPARLSVAYPDDPAWTGGVVVKDIELEFSGGEEHVLIAKPTYEHRLGIEDGNFPLAVAPAASGDGLPMGSDGAGARLPLLLLVGEAVSGEVGLGADEPSPEPGKVWQWQSGSSFAYEDAGALSVALEQGQPASFRLSLVDGSFEVVAEGEFLVHRCPKGDHQPEARPLAACGLEPVASQGGVVASITVNPGGQGDGGSRGYLGIELTRAPIAPGAVFILVESLGPTRYRIRQQAHYFEGRGGEEEHRGAFYLASVMGGEILDEKFQRVDPLAVHDWPTGAYVRSLEPSGSAAEVSARVVYSENGVDIREATARLARLGPATAGPAVYLSPLSLVPSSGSCPLPAGSARALDIPFDSLAVTYGRITAYVAGAIRALVGVDALPQVTLAINKTADSSDDIVAVEPPDPTDVRVTLSGGCFDVSFVTEPPGMAALLPSMAKLGDGEAATVQLFAVDTSQEPQDVMLRAYVLGYRVAERAFTNIKAEILSTDITVEPEQRGIALRLQPKGMTGLHLKLDLVRPDSSTFSLVDDEVRTGDDQTESFQLDRLPVKAVGEFTSARVEWGMPPVTAQAQREYHFQNLGIWRHTQYNSPVEAEPTCAGPPVAVCTTDADCNFQVGALSSTFVDEVMENGSGVSVAYGPIQREWHCTESPPECLGVMVFRRGTRETTCGGPPVHGQLAAGDGTALAVPSNCGRKVFVVGSGLTTVGDKCPACKGDDHVDSFSDYPGCRDGGEPGELQTIKLW